MATTTKWALLGVLIWSNSPSAYAYCMPPPPKACSLWFSSDVVFVGKVLKYGHTEDLDYERYELRVSRVLKGSVARSTVVFTGNDTGRVTWAVGETYVVFAHRANGRLEVGDGCGDQSDPNRAARFLDEIAAVKKSTSASIEGRVVRQWGSSAGVQGFRVRVAGSAKEYTTTSDKEGYFKIRMPVGSYRVLIDPRSVAPGDDVQRVDLQAGQCALFEFRAPEVSR